MAKHFLLFKLYLPISKLIDALMDGAKNVIKDVLRDCEDRNIKEWAYLKNNIKENLKEYLYTKTKRNPMILPIIMEV